MTMTLIDGGANVNSSIQMNELRTGQLGKVITNQHIVYPVIHGDIRLFLVLGDNNSYNAYSGDCSMHVIPLSSKEKITVCFRSNDN